MPPSDNELKKIIHIRGMPRMAKSRAYNQYLGEIRLWALKNQDILEKARLLTLQCNPGWALKLTAIYWYQPKTVILQNDSKKTNSKKGEPKKHDVTNRIKALNDGLFSLLGADDKYIWECDVRKKLLNHLAFPECVDIELAIIDMHRD